MGEGMNEMTMLETCGENSPRQEPPMGPQRCAVSRVSLWFNLISDVVPVWYRKLVRNVRIHLLGEPTGLEVLLT